MKSNNKVRRIPVRRPAPGSSPAATTPGAIARCKTVCASCNLRELCAPCCNLTGPEREIAARLPFTRLRLRRGERLYRAGDRFSALYAVRSGFFKSESSIENGREQVTGFAMAGEILGLDAIAPEHYVGNAIALEDSEVCAIAFPGLVALTRELPSLQGQFYRMMSREIARGQGMMLQLGSMNAEERLAMFLLNLSRRFAARGYSASEFHLRMTREEIGSYLGLKLETISRTLSRFHEQGLIAVQQKFVRILDRAGLESVLGRALG